MEHVRCNIVHIHEISFLKMTVDVTRIEQASWPFLDFGYSLSLTISIQLSILKKGRPLTDCIRTQQIANSKV